MLSCSENVKCLTVNCTPNYNKSLMKEYHTQVCYVIGNVFAWYDTLCGDGTC